MPLQLADRLGSQTPRVESVPPWVTSSGEDAADLAELAGLVLDPWQRHVLMGGLGQRGDGRWTASELAVVVPRQNGKGAILEALELLGLFLLGEQIVHTAHLMATSRKAHARLWELIRSTPVLAEQVKQRRVANEDQSIELHSGAKIEFVARSQGSARGWTEDRIVLDEAFALNDDHIGALMPTLITRPNWQIVYASSAGLAHSEVLRRIRDRGMAGAPGLAYYEWSVDQDAYRENPEAVAADEESWERANPALGIRITRESIGLLQQSMDAAEFAREILTVWDDARGRSVIDPAAWALLTDEASQIEGDMVFALDCSPGLESGAIDVAGHRPDGKAHLEVIEHRPGVDWVVPRAAELAERWRPRWVLDPGGPAGALLPDLRAAGIEPELVTGREFAQACGAFLKAVVAPGRDRVRHLGQPSLAAAVVAARKRDIGDGAWAWGRRASDEDISPLVAATLALHGLSVFGGVAIEGSLMS